MTTSHAIYNAKKAAKQETSELRFEMEDRKYTLKDLGEIAKKIRAHREHEADLAKIAAMENQE